MDQARWARLDALFEGALDQPPAQRAAWIEGACGADEELRRELERLVALSERDDDGLRPAGAMTATLWDDVARELRSPAEVRTFSPGDALGPYRIRELIGSGGMGHVYVAEDARLSRRVALKVLPPEMASPERRKRFEREAVAIAALNHPNIIHIYSVEEADGTHIMTMELVRGRTLAELIPKGGFPLKELLRIAVDVADALAAAHGQGIIHRDLKPANVMVSAEGRVKVLDFGLAKLTPEAARMGLAELPHSSATVEGQILGTVSHMSPEQAEGRPLDHRTDVFSLGVLLYEMSTGRLPFRGDSAAATLSAILHDTPATVTELNPRLPTDLGRIVKRCLAKDPARRYQTALDVRNDLEELSYEVDSRKLFRSLVPRRTARSRGRVAAALGALAALGAVAGVVVSRWDRPSRPIEGTFSQLTSDPGQELFPSLSPDGRFLAYASPAGGDWDVYLLRAGGSRPINLTAEPGSDDTQPAYSPDGERIAFRSTRDGGGLFVMGATGESVRRLTDFGWNPTWSPDGRRIAFATAPVSRSPLDRPTRSELWVVEVESGERRRLDTGDAVQPSWSPSGHRIAYWAVSADGAQRDLWTIPAEGGEAVPATDDAAVDWNPVWSPDGEWLYFASDRGGSMNLWRVAIDERTGRTERAPEPVTAPSPFACHLSLSRDGSRLAYASAVIRQSVEALAFDPRSGQVIGDPRRLVQDIGGVSTPRVSPDGEWLAYYRAGVEEDVVIVRPDGTGRRPLTDDPYRDRFPEWSPDGERLVFYSNRGGSYDAWTIARDGGGLAKLTDLPDADVRYPFWSPDGERMAFSTPGTSGAIFDPRRPWSEQSPEPLPPYGQDRDFVPSHWSPDGRHLAGFLMTADGRRGGIAVYTLETREYAALTDFGTFPRWLPDSRRILFQGEPGSVSGQPLYDEQRQRLFVVDRVSGAAEEIFAVAGGSAETPDVTRDGRTVYFLLSAAEADLWMMEFGG